MANYTITVKGVDEETLKEAVDIAVEAVRGTFDKAGLGELEVNVNRNRWDEGTAGRG